MAGESSDKGITLERILQAAQKEFATRGFGGASIETIARDANVTKQLVYHYFQTKDRLYKATLESVAHGVEVLLDPEIYRSLNAVEALTLIVNRIVDENVENPFYAALELDQGLHQGAHITGSNRYIPITIRFIDEIIRPLVERGIASGELRSGLDAELVYWLIMHAATGCFHNSTVMSQTTDMDFDSTAGISTWRNAAIDFILHALCNKTDPDSQ
jgi:AcrR family transcriptional regulator